MPVLAAPDLETPLSTAMRQGSQVEHQQAESSIFMSELLAGRINEKGYGEYLLRLRLVYEALECTVRSRLDDPVIAAVHDTRLERLNAIDADLEHWAPGRSREVDSPAAVGYRDRLSAAAEWGGWLAAHHYTRYLGDLSGGQAIGRILDRAFDLGGAGISFYTFPDIPKPKPYKDNYRARLDALGMSHHDKTRIVTEVKAAFRLNQALFAELGANLPTYAR